MINFDNEKIGKLGFGMMRLPKLPDNSFDISTIKGMVKIFLDEGFNYFDTAFCYPGSENIIREVLVNCYPRDCYKIATKVSSWLCKSREEGSYFKKIK